MAKQIIVKGTLEPDTSTDGFVGGTAITEWASGNGTDVPVDLDGPGGAHRRTPPYPDDVGDDDPELMLRGHGGFLVFG